MFLAAVHNAHFCQPRELVHYWCQKALRLYPGISEVFLRYIDMQAGYGPMLFGKAAEQIASLQFPSIHHYLLRWNLHQLDIVLIDAIVDSLMDFDINARPRLNRLRSEHSVTRDSVNLLDYYYYSAGLSADEVLTMRQASKRRSACYRAYSDESRFVFIGEGSYPVSFQLTARLFAVGPETGTIRVEVNGIAESKLLLDRAWRSFNIAVGPETIQNGVNEVVVHWPPLEVSGRRGLERAAEDLMADLDPELHPVFGEIHSFTASGYDMRSGGLDTSTAEEQLSPRR